MAATASAGAITREEFDAIVDRMNSRLVALEAEPPRTPVQVEEAGRAAGSVPLAVVTQSEFRLFKWFGAFALATVVGGFSFLYQQSDRQFDNVRTEFDNVRMEMQNLRTEIGTLRTEMRSETASIRADLADVSERVVRVDRRGKSHARAGYWRRTPPVSACAGARNRGYLRSNRPCSKGSRARWRRSWIPFLGIESRVSAQLSSSSWE